MSVDTAKEIYTDALINEGEHDLTSEPDMTATERRSEFLHDHDVFVDSCCDILLGNDDMLSGIRLDLACINSKTTCLTNERHPLIENLERYVEREKDFADLGRKIYESMVESFS